MVTSVVLGLVASRVILMCTWRLSTMVRRETVFSHAAFRYVEIMTSAFGRCVLDPRCADASVWRTRVPVDAAPA